WTAWVFTTLLFSPGGYDARWRALTLFSWPLFLELYALALVRPPRETRRYALAMAALSIGLLPWYPARMTYFVFGCVMLRGDGPLAPRTYAAWVLLLNLVFAAVALSVGYPWQAIAWMPVVTLIVGVIIHVDHANRARDAALRLSHEEVRRLAASAERERIGRDLHDLLGHTLSLVAVKSELAARLVEREPARARAEIDAVSQVAREALAQVRSAVTGIRAAGLAAELASARLLLECEGVALVHDCDAGATPDGRALPAPVETALAMVLREAVTNIQRHAHARRAEVTLDPDGRGEGVVLRVADDGRGGSIAPGNGLDGMRRRVEALGGRLDVSSTRGRGTVVEAWLPLRGPGADA